MSAAPVQISLKIEAPNEAALLAWAIMHLEAHGYSVQAPKWETPGEFHYRLGVGCEAIGRALRRDGCPNVALRRANGGKGRIAEICSNEHFEAFVLRYKNRPKAEPRQRPSRKKPADQLQRARMNGPVRSFV